MISFFFWHCNLTLEISNFLLFRRILAWPIKEKTGFICIIKELVKDKINKLGENETIYENVIPSITYSPLPKQSVRLLLWICLEVQLAACPRGTGSDLWYTSQVSVAHPEGHLTSQSRLCLQFHTWPTANRCNSSFCLFVCLFYLNMFSIVFPKAPKGDYNQIQLSNLKLSTQI